MDVENYPAVDPGPSVCELPPTSESRTKDRPLLKLMKIVIHVVSKEEKTILTNCHLLDILQKEFGIDIEKKTQLEIDIYLNVIKKFLKLWPRWNEFDKLIRESTKDPKKILNDVLTDECKDLQNYLDGIFKLTEGQITPVLRRLEMENAKQPVPEEEEGKDVKEGEVTMEVSCSRDQLNELIYRRPVRDTIFHVSDGSNKTSVKSFNLATILNWPNVSVSINLPWLGCFRQNSSNFEWLLKNLKLQTASAEPKDLNKEIYWRKCKTNNNKKWVLRKVSVVKLFNDLLEYIETADMNQNHQHNRQRITEVLLQFKHDLVRGPDSIALGAEYQFYLNRYKYVRHLSKEPPPSEECESVMLQNGIDGESFDLRLEETVSPAQRFQITNLCNDNEKPLRPQLSEKDLKHFWDTNNSWLKIECITCKKTFQGFLTWHFLQQHFIENHSSEIDWTCQNCKRIFPMQVLAKNRWFHTCLSS